MPAAMRTHRSRSLIELVENSSSSVGSLFDGSFGDFLIGCRLRWSSLFSAECFSRHTPFTPQPCDAVARAKRHGLLSRIMSAKKSNGAPPRERRIFRLHTVEEVIRALDGPTAAGRLVGKSRQSMCNAIRP